MESGIRPWARGRSRRYLWKPQHVARAIFYVLYGQGDIPDFDDERICTLPDGRVSAY